MSRSEDELDGLLSRTVSAAETLRDTSTAAPGELRGVGRDPDHLVTVTLSATGRVEKVEIDQRGMRLASSELAGRAMAAVNAALADLEDANAGRPAEAVDRASLTELTKGLGDLQDRSLRQLAAQTQAFRDLMNSFERR
ncbi:YbaB/EbfC family nucleoid-associated protein [Spirillospora sp. NPDC048911]|uniref:YbaB/EbfC family nucleoid-associated protein n=1 Tax=Spirillospora sp. NPDC048911 TaxID=3364527 RepID=UPI00371EABF7